MWRAEGSEEEAVAVAVVTCELYRTTQNTDKLRLSSPPCPSRTQSVSPLSSVSCSPPADPTQARHRRRRCVPSLAPCPSSSPQVPVERPRFSAHSRWAGFHKNMSVLVSSSAPALTSFCQEPSKHCPPFHPGVPNHAQLCSTTMWQRSS